MQFWLQEEKRTEESGKHTKEGRTRKGGRAGRKAGGLAYRRPKSPARRAAFLAAFAGLLLFRPGAQARAAPESVKEGGDPVSYTVSFTDEENETLFIFPSQEGTVPEGTILTVSFPERIIGSDGHIWISAAQSPQQFIVYQAGTQKFSVFYRQKEATGRPEGESGQKRLERWLEKAWQADCAILGRDGSEPRPADLTVKNREENDRRIRSLASALGDSEWHEFYLIGENYAPETAILGTEASAAGSKIIYAPVKEDSFSFAGKRYEIWRIRVRRSWEEETCLHRWQPEERTEPTCLLNGRASWICSLCKARRETVLAAPGHRDADRDLRCDRCQSEQLAQRPEALSWKEGDVQIRRAGEEYLSFTCVDEDYHDWQDGRRKAALFLCDRLIRSDVLTEPQGESLCLLSFGRTNNYKDSAVRTWLKCQIGEEDAGLEPIHTGVQTAWTGRTKAEEYSQLSAGELSRHDIGYQLMQDSYFCLSLEEALRYRDWLWRFSSGQENPESQMSAYSQGYYLRTPFYEEDEHGRFVYGQQIYVVDLDGSVHPAPVSSETYGLRPAFAVPQA